MKKLTALIAGTILAVAAPLAGAFEAQLELLPKLGGAEMTSFEKPEQSTAGINRDNAFYYQHTGGVPPQ